MTGCGIDFLENWVNKNVTGEDRKGSKARAKELAALCKLPFIQLFFELQNCPSKILSIGPR